MIQWIVRIHPVFLRGHRIGARLTVADRCAIHDHGKGKLANKVRQASHFVQKLKRDSARRFPIARLQTLSRRGAPDRSEALQPTGNIRPPSERATMQQRLSLQEKSDCE